MQMVCVNTVMRARKTRIAGCYDNKGEYHTFCTNPNSSTVSGKCLEKA